jgi:hypothetical protein
VQLSEDQVAKLVITLLMVKVDKNPKLVPSSLISGFESTVDLIPLIVDECLSFFGVDLDTAEGMRAANVAMTKLEL